MRALLCPLTSPGYLYPATALALELHRRGHEVTLLSAAGAATAARADGLDVHDVDALPEPGAFEVSRWFRSSAAQYRAVLELARARRPDVLVTSVLCPGALLAAETLDLPVVVLGLTCHLWTFDAPHTADGADDADRGWRLEQSLAMLDTARQEVGLPARAPAAGMLPLLGQAFLLRGHPDLEPQGALLPEQVRHVGPLWWEPPADPGRLEQAEEFLARSDRPLAYVHLGRTFGGTTLWPWIDAAFTGTGHRAVVELGRTEEHRSAPGADVLTVRLPWMSALLDRADLVVANGTSAPVLGALLHDRPLLLRPNGGEQRVIASAALRAGVAAELPVSAADLAHPAGPVGETLADPVLRSRVRRLGEALRQTKSAALAAQAVEEACR
ncbi:MULTISPECIES: glycosyltransferase [Streptacidiphilus]|uniref:Glycosyltransferase n=1 Tax=Streptacidiphilus cavernicola TaxID=3342716 RepID=A0ABV6UIE9_9ACTN|nr:glycosyltransferase [Streptacidiphilus jeojiense]